MKAIKFNEVNAEKKFDKYGAFWKPLVGADSYYREEIMAIFETGEVRVNRPTPSPMYRYHDHQLDIELYSTSDGYLKFATPDGEKVPTAWLKHHGTQYLLVDHTHKMAVRLGSHWGANRLKDLPGHLDGCVAYYPTVGSKPVGMPVATHRPDKAFAKDKKDWLDEVRAACRALDKIDGLEPGYWRGTDEFPISRHLTKVEPGEFVAALGKREVQRIADNGFYLGRVEVKVPYLLLA